jgi:tRNA dimethylallyltransferase
LRNSDNYLIILLGPTASGKTDLAIRLARHFHTEIISADSRQFYKEIPIGTAAPDKDQLRTVKHHFVGHLKIGDNYNVSMFEQDVLELLKQKFTGRNIMLMTGGSGLYIDAVCKGIDNLPDPNPQLRAELQQQLHEKGLKTLQDQLLSLDPEYHRQADLNNPKRVLRALEVCIQTGKTYSELRQNQPKQREFNILKIGLEVPREVLHERISTRTELMLEKGWLEEAREVLPLRHLNALNTVGYKELFAYFNGFWDFETAVEKIRTNTRRYAKRQMTWFRKDEEIEWFSPKDFGAIVEYIENKVGA